MSYEQRYKNAKKRLLQDPIICEKNRVLFARFFEYHDSGWKFTSEGSYTNASKGKVSSNSVIRRLGSLSRTLLR